MKSLEKLFGFSLNTEWELRGLGFIVWFSGLFLFLSSTVVQSSCPDEKTKMLEHELGCSNVFPGGIFSPTI